jgi:hypothetical protein
MRPWPHHACRCPSPLVKQIFVSRFWFFFFMIWFIFVLARLMFQYFDLEFLFEEFFFWFFPIFDSILDYCFKIWNSWPGGIWPYALRVPQLHATNYRARIGSTTAHPHGIFTLVLETHYICRKKLSLHVCFLFVYATEYWMEHCIVKDFLFKIHIIPIVRFYYIYFSKCS